MKVHLIDGTFELFRAFFGAPGALSPSGQEVGATRGLLRSFNALVQQADVTHVACAFDQVIESFRNRLFDGYKTGEGLDPVLYAQFHLAERATRALGIVVWPMVEFEADDALATGAAIYGADPRVEEVVVCSPDKDLTQCATDPKVVLFDRIRNKRMRAHEVREKFGVDPSSIPDYLALVGDSADGIPGVPRWGQKSAGAVLARYERLENIPARAADWDVKVRGAAALAENLAAQQEKALLYRKLATLRQDVPLAECLDDLEYRGAPRAELAELCAELGETELLDRVKFA